MEADHRYGPCCIPTPFHSHRGSLREKRQNFEQYSARIHHELRQEFHRALTVKKRNGSAVCLLDFAEPLSIFQADSSMLHSFHKLLQEWVRFILSTLMHLLFQLRKEIMPETPPPANTAWVEKIVMLVAGMDLGDQCKREWIEQVFCRQLKEFILIIPPILHSNVTLLQSLSFSEKRELLCGVAFTAARLYFRCGFPLLSNRDCIHSWDKLHQERSRHHRFPYTAGYFKDMWRSRLLRNIALNMEYLKGDPREYFWITLYKDMVEEYTKPIGAMQDHLRFQQLLCSSSSQDWP